VAEVGQLAAGIRADTSNEATRTTAAPAPPRRWRLVDRLGEQIIRDLLRDSRAGITQRRLAVRYGISLSSVKRLLRDMADNE
jgi:DNA-binding GntR family transcriptional regulator